MRIVDVTWSIHEGMATPMASWHPRVAISILGRHHQEGRSTREYVLGSHTGSHMDAPHHFVENGITIDEIPLERLVSQALVMDLSEIGESFEIDIADLERHAGKLERGDSVILNTGWWKQWGTSRFYESWPYLTGGACQWLIDRGVRLVAMDTPSPDNPSEDCVLGEVSPNHYRFLSNDVILVEYLANLDQISSERVTLLALPLKIRGGDGAPGRFLVLED
jgi:kynurenine formamidase